MENARNVYMEALRTARDSIKASPMLDGVDNSIPLTDLRTGQVNEVNAPMAANVLATGNHRISTPEEYKAYRDELARRTEYIIAGNQPKKGGHLEAIAASIASVLASRASERSAR